MSKYLNLDELFDLLQQNGLSAQQSKQSVQTILEALTEVLVNEGKVDLKGFGKFDVAIREPRVGYNPSTKEKMLLPANKVIRFRPSAQLKRKLNTK